MAIIVRFYNSCFPKVANSMIVYNGGLIVDSNIFHATFGWTLRPSVYLLLILFIQHKLKINALNISIKNVF